MAWWVGTLDQQAASALAWRFRRQDISSPFNVTTISCDNISSPTDLSFQVLALATPYTHKCPLELKTRDSTDFHISMINLSPPLLSAQHHYLTGIQTIFGSSDMGMSFRERDANKKRNTISLAFVDAQQETD